MRLDVLEKILLGNLELHGYSLLCVTNTAPSGNFNECLTVFEQHSYDYKYEIAEVDRLNDEPDVLTAARYCDYQLIDIIIKDGMIAPVVYPLSSSKLCESCIFVDRCCNALFGIKECICFFANEKQKKGETNEETIRKG